VFVVVRETERDTVRDGLVEAYSIAVTIPQTPQEVGEKTWQYSRNQQSVEISEASFNDIFDLSYTLKESTSRSLCFDCLAVRIDVVDRSEYWDAFGHPGSADWEKLQAVSTEILKLAERHLSLAEGISQDFEERAKREHLQRLESQKQIDRARRASRLAEPK
jgi:hypothetical protein